MSETHLTVHHYNAIYDAATYRKVNRKMNAKSQMLANDCGEKT